MAEVAGVPVGFCTLGRRAGGLGVVELFYVDPAHARRSVGRALLAGVVEEARRAGLRRLAADASTPGAALFAGLGFRVLGVHHKALGRVWFENRLMALDL